MSEIHRGRCFVCARRVKFDPTRAHLANGYPVCAHCLGRVNELLAAAGHRQIDTDGGAEIDE